MRPSYKLAVWSCEAYIGFAVSQEVRMCPLFVQCVTRKTGRLADLLNFDNIIRWPRAVPCFVDPFLLNTQLRAPLRHFSYTVIMGIASLYQPRLFAATVFRASALVRWFTVSLWRLLAEIKRSSGRAVCCVMCHSLGAQCEYRNQCSISRHAAPFCVKYSGNMTVLPLDTKSVCKYFWVCGL